MAMSSAAEDAWPARGFTFSAADHVLINDFLRRKLAGLPIDGRCKIHEVDAYSLSPDDLVDNREHAPGTDKHNGKGGDWYFFTPARRHAGGGRRQRTVGGGYTWHTEGGKKPVLDAAGEKRVGYKEKLSYGFYEVQPGARTATLTRLGWCMTEFSLDDAGAGLVLCKVYVSTHKTETTYASVMKATADSKKRKAGGDPHPDAPRPHKKTTTYASVMKASDDAPRAQTPRRQESEQRQELERWLLSDEDDPMPAGGVDNGSVDPAGFFADILQEFGGARAEPAQDDRRWECTMEELLGEDNMDLVAPAPEFVPCDSSSSQVMAPSHVCSNSADCGICIQQMLDELID
ncbi:unnamed protein product [Alopecurus aequalis]